jgi:hypothetical protein
MISHSPSKSPACSGECPVRRLHLRRAGEVQGRRGEALCREVARPSSLHEVTGHYIVNMGEKVSLRSDLEDF